MAAGPVELVVIEFPRNRFRGDIAQELARLVDAGLVRIQDMAFMSKDASGDVTWLGPSIMDPSLLEGLLPAGDRLAGRLTRQDACLLGARLRPNTSAVLLVWEKRWEAGLSSAVLAAGGTLRCSAPGGLDLAS